MKHEYFVNMNEIEYTGVSVSVQVPLPIPLLCDSLTVQLLSAQFDPRGLGIRTPKRSDSLCVQLLSIQLAKNSKMTFSQLIS